MRYCDKCGNIIDDNVAFCPVCGAKVGEISTSCPRCGEKLNADERYCHKCGYAMNGIQQEEVKSGGKTGGAIGFLLALLVIVLIILGLVKLAEGSFSETFFPEDEHVTMVKNGYPLDYPDITYGEAFENFFSNRSWRYFESDKGADVVEFKGDCIYRDAEVTVTLQFILDTEEGTFETGYLAFNDVPQSLLIEYALITKVFESY